MLIEKVEQTKKELSPLMQGIRKYMPQAEYGYHVVSDEYPAFYGMRIEFTYSGIRFHMYKMNKENKHKITTDMGHFKYVDRHDIERADNQYEKPYNIGVFTARKINGWINYCTQMYKQVEQEDAENSKKVAGFLRSIENEPVGWERRNYAKGTMTRNGLRFTFYIEKGHLSFKLSLSYRRTADCGTFRLLADNHYIP